MEPPSFLLSDAGQVMVRTDAEACRTAIAGLFGCTADTTKEILWFSQAHYDLERGKVSWEEYYVACTQQLLNHGTRQPVRWNSAVLQRYWRRVLTDPVEEVLEMWALLARHLTIVLASNTNALHYRQMHHRRHGILRHVRHRHTSSHLLGHRKGDEEYFEALLRSIGAQPHECIFVDDKPEFVGQAKRHGLRACWLASPTAEHVDILRWELQHICGVPGEWLPVAQPVPELVVQLAIP